MAGFTLAFAQLRPHDQQVFARAEEFVAGEVPPPRLSSRVMKKSSAVGQLDNNASRNVLF